MLTSALFTSLLIIPEVKTISPIIYRKKVTLKRIREIKGNKLIPFIGDIFIVRKRNRTLTIYSKKAERRKRGNLKKRKPPLPGARNY